MSKQFSLNPSLAGTTSPTNSLPASGVFGTCLNPSLAGTTSPTYENKVLHRSQMS